MFKQTAIFLACIVILSNPAWADLTTGLVAHYPFDGNANDIIGNNNGVLHGGVKPDFDYNGNPNGAYHFDGIDSYITADASNLPSLTRTVAILFRPDDFTYLPSPVLFGYGGGGCGTSFLIGFSSNYFAFSHCGGPELGTKNFSSTFITSWTHLVITTTDTRTAIYVNGIKKASNTAVMNTDVTEPKPLAIGVSVASDGSVPFINPDVGYFKGIIDDIKIYNRALSAAEIGQLYYQINPPKIAGTAPWKTKHTVTCYNITQNTSVAIPTSTKDGWNCEAAGLNFNSGDQVEIKIKGVKY